MLKIINSKKVITEVKTFDGLCLYGSDSSVVLPDNLDIPDVSEDELAFLYSKLKPIITRGNRKFMLKEHTLEEIYGSAIFFEPKLGKRISEKNLETIEDYICVHRAGPFAFWLDYCSRVLFMPSAADILVQTPQNVLEQADLFEIVEQPITIEDVYRYQQAVDNMRHLSRVRAYKLHK